MDVRFSKPEFLSRPEGLAKELQSAVLERIQKAVDQEFRQIVNELNSQGHRLVLYELEPGVIAFRDDSDESGQKQKCDLRLAVDIVISAGFRDTAEF